MLEPFQIEQIEKQVNCASISYSHLADDLIDHICCDVEERMYKGESFDQAFFHVKEEIGIEGLKKIQDQTILFINQNYIIMKKALNVFSITSVSLVVISGLFKLFHLPAANIVLGLAFMALLFGFLPLLFLTRNKEDRERKQVWVNLSGYLAATVFLLSLYWGLMHWPGRTWLILLSWIITLGFFLPSFLSYSLQQKSESQKLTNIGITLLIVFLFVIEIVLTFNNRTSKYWSQDTVVNNLHEMTEYYQHQNQHFYADLDTLTSLTEKEKSLLLLLKDKSSTFEKELVSLALDIESLNNFSSLRLKDKKPDDFHERTMRLKHLAEDYEETIGQEFSLSPELKKLLEKTMDTQGEKGINMYELYFTKPAVIIRNNMYRLNRDILIIENEILQQFMQKT